MVNIHDLNVDVSVLQEHRDTLEVCVQFLLQELFCQCGEVNSKHR